MVEGKAEYREGVRQWEIVSYRQNSIRRLKGANANQLLLPPVPATPAPQVTPAAVAQVPPSAQAPAPVAALVIAPIQPQQ